MKQIQLTIGILVSNRIQYIRKVMEGIKPLLDSLPCELIAIDTKGTDSDGSIDIVREYTDKIYPFEWCNDFSKARNLVFEHAQGEWFLQLDDDEVLDNTTDFIAFFQSDEHKNYNCGCFTLRNYEADGNYTTTTPTRLFRRQESTRYVGAVHEQINDVRPPMKQLSSVIHHYGYAFQTLDDAIKHQERNVSILKQELERTGYTPHLCAQMTQELIYLETSTDEGFRFATHALSVLKNTNQLLDPATQYILFATVLYYLRKQDIPHAREQVQNIFEQYPLTEVTKLVFHGLGTTLAFDDRDITDMLFHATSYLALWDWKNAYASDAAPYMIFNFPQYCTEKYYYRILHIGAAAANELEQYVTAYSFWKRLPLDLPGFDNKPYEIDLNVTMLGLKRVQLLRKKQAELLQQIELLEQADQQVQTLSTTGQNALATEYLTSIQQLLPVLENACQTLLGVQSSTTQLLKAKSFPITELKPLFLLDSEQLLSKNPLI